MILYAPIVYNVQAGCIRLSNFCISETARPVLSCAPNPTGRHITTPLPVITSTLQNIYHRFNSLRQAGSRRATGARREAAAVAGQSATAGSLVTG